MTLNPLLERDALPRLELVSAADVVPALNEILQHNRRIIKQLLEQGEAAAWDQLAQPMQELSERLHDCWSSISHLHGVDNSDALRAAYDEGLALLTAYNTELGQHAELFQAYLELQRSQGFATLGQAQRKAVDNALRDFRLSGVALEHDARQRFAALQQRLAELSTTFSNNVLDASQAWFVHLEDASRLQGVPDSVCETLRQQAALRQLDGFVVTLDMPCYLPVMQYASDRELRRELYQAYSTRASDQGPDAGRWDNSTVMVEILAARKEMAHLLGYDNYAELSLVTKMASEPEQVMEFLRSLAEKSRPVALREFKQLQQFSQQADGLAQLEAWDVPYYSEMLRQQRYDISQQQLRPYLPAPKVIAGMFEVAGRLFGVSFQRDENFQGYHVDVTFYRVLRDGQMIAGFYLDPYARENKRGGAWMADCRNRYRNEGGELQLPIAFLTCNFTAPHSDQPALLTHDEVTTLFHEFGHGLHHMLTRVEVADVSGINGVAWDAVELPSQFMENWCWQKPALDLISGHFETGEPLPEDLLDKLLAAKNFQAGMMMMRQLEFALFDFSLHMSDSIETSGDIQLLLDDVRQQYAVVPVPRFNRFQHGFSHIFAGGYGAGYYSYKWAELLSADAFSRFEQEGIFDADVGADFRREILELGGAREAADCFRVFRGRDPDSDALLRHSGILSAGS